MAITNTIDWDALNAKLKTLSAQNANVLNPTGVSLPTPRTSSAQISVRNPVKSMTYGAMGSTGPAPYTEKKQTVTGTPGEIAKLQNAMKNGYITQSGNGYTMWNGGLGTTTKLGDPINAQADSLIQALEAEGLGAANDLVMGALKGSNKGMNLAALQTAYQDYVTQKQSTQQQANNYKAGTDLLTDAVTQGNQNLDQIGADLQAKTGQLSDMWARTLAKADEIVVNAQKRTQSVLADVDAMLSKMNTDMNFEQAHTMQATVQSALGQMAGEEKIIARQYGMDSEEMMQFNQTKRQTLAAMQSNVYATYGNLRSTMRQNALATRTQAASNMAMYENYNEQAMLETYKAAAQADQAYQLQATEDMIAIENLKMSNQSSLADWIANTPVFSTSLSGLVSLALELA